MSIPSMVDILPLNVPTPVTTPVPVLFPLPPTCILEDMSFADAPWDCRRTVATINALVQLAGMVTDWLERVDVPLKFPAVIVVIVLMFV